MTPASRSAWERFFNVYKDDPVVTRWQAILNKHREGNMIRCVNCNQVLEAKLIPVTFSIDDKVYIADTGGYPPGIIETTIQGIKTIEKENGTFIEYELWANNWKDAENVFKSPEEVVEHIKQKILLNWQARKEKQL